MLEINLGLPEAPALHQCSCTYVNHIYDLRLARLRVTSKIQYSNTHKLPQALFPAL